ncbi:hypothetical protein E2562_019506 [Oryza meyeriana var. granulata]|uniref:Uncharacterized protein n=1 Tax=Oryza meyeriana var. granulata TaxID=110450 RepID=A0A6G1CGV4_9ORYZ|nr:hypothetical protein E2562_019506 [Oryza meyeriana var. granulata]
MAKKQGKEKRKGELGRSRGRRRSSNSLGACEDCRQKRAPSTAVEGRELGADQRKGHPLATIEAASRVERDRGEGLAVATSRGRLKEMAPEIK